MADGRARLQAYVAPIARIRRTLRSAVYGFFRAAFNTDDGRRLLFDVVRGFEPPRETLTLERPPYDDLGVARHAGPARTPVFITARFRSGSTLLWQIFRAVPGATSYYEPHNERRWFDVPNRSGTVDPTHGVDDYWREYDDVPALARWYHESWIDRHLYMDAGFSDPDMRAFIAYMIDHAPGRPVLQFNHVDFRLPWLCHQFPEARLIHLYRHPRDQWVSTLVRPDATPRDLSTADFSAHDHFYLLNWTRDLSYRFPFLDPRHESHPYRLFYLVWRLSQLHGERYAHHSVSFEQLTANPRIEIARMLQAAHWPGVDVEPLAALVQGNRSGAWKTWAPAAWFEDHESACEETLTRELGGLAASVVRPAVAYARR